MWAKSLNGSSVSMLTIKEAQNIIFEAATVVKESQELFISEVRGLVLRENILADRALPPFNRSMMDGYAGKISQLNITTSFKVKGEVFPGDNKKFDLKPNEVVRIFTGAKVPDGLDIVIQQEWFEKKGDEVILVNASVNLEAWKNIHLEASDAKANSTLIESGKRLRASDLAVLSSVGKTRVKTTRPLKINLVSTGDEIILPTDIPGVTQIRDAHFYVLGDLTKKLGAEAFFMGPLRDERQILKQSLEKALLSDVVVICAGVSVGDKDFVPEILEELGVKKIFHHINLKPGHPLWFGKKDNTLVFGLPGNPVSSQVCFKLFVEPTIRKMQGETNFQTRVKQYQLAQTVTKKHNRDEWAMAALNTEMKVKMIKNTGSGDFFHLSSIDGLAFLPGTAQTYEAGTMIDWIDWYD